MKEQSDIKSEAREHSSNKAHSFKKKGGCRIKGKRQQSTADDFIRGVGFSVGRDGPELYLRTIDRLGLYVNTQFKNSYNMKICLMQEKVIKLAVLDLADNHTAHEKRI